MNELKKEIIKTYEKIAPEYDKEFCQDIYFLEHLDFFLDKLPKKALILDVGCGSGHVAKHCEEKGFQVLGIDLSDKMLEIARKRCKKSKFIKEDVETFEYGKDKFDGIIALFILIHFKNFKKLLKKWYTALKPQALLFLSMIKGHGEYLGPEPLKPEYKMYFKYVTKEEIKQSLVEVGFEIIRFKEQVISTEHEKQTEFFIIAKKPTA